MRRAIHIALVLTLIGVIYVAGQEPEHNYDLQLREQCMPPKGGEICSGHGECHNGKCRCKETEEGHYSGKYCQTCPTCSGRCHELKYCIQCRMYHMGPLIDDCYDNCDKVIGPQIGGADKVVLYEGRNEQLCMFYDEDDCKFIFKYSEDDDGKLEVEAQRKRQCPGSYSSFWEKAKEKIGNFFTRECPEYWENFKAEMRKFFS